MSYEKFTNNLGKGYLKDGINRRPKFNNEYGSWYLHSEYNKSDLNFFTCITRNNYYKLCGFDERYRFGTGFDDNEFLKTCIEKSGICILHAPLFHPAMKHVAPIRRELGLKTFFNILGPLVNPSFPKNQIVGVFNLELARLYSYLFQKTKKNYSIIFSLDGYDEISLTGSTKIISRKQENIYSPKNLGFKTLTQKSICGGKTIGESAKIFINVLSNKGTISQKNVVIANSGLAISTALEVPILEGIERAIVPEHYE